MRHGLAPKEQRTLAWGKLLAPPQGNTQREFCAPAGRRKDLIALASSVFSGRELLWYVVRGRRPLWRSCPRLISAVPSGRTRELSLTRKPITPKTAQNSRLFCKRSEERRLCKE